MATLVIISAIGKTTSASYIEITTNISSGTLNQNSTNLSLSVIQNGDEAAYQIELEPKVPDGFQVNRSITASILEPGEKLNGNCTITVNETLHPGKYPIVFLVKYHDANQYPFSMVAQHLLTYENGSNSKVYGTISETKINEDGSGTTTLTVRNLDDQPHQIEMNLYLPLELKGALNKENISLNAKEEKEVEIEIESFGALAESDYTIFASLEYEHQNYHYSSFANGQVEITEKDNTEKRKNNNYFIWILVGLFITLFLVFIYLTVWKKKRGNK